MPTKETWADWEDLEADMSANIKRYIDKKLDGQSSDFKMAILSGIIGDLTINIREHIKLEDETDV